MSTDEKGSAGESAQPSDEKTPVQLKQSSYPGYVVVHNIWNAFLNYRGLDVVARRGAAGAPTEPSRDTTTTELTNYGHLRIDAKRRAPRGERDSVIILILEPGGKYARYSQDLRGLLGGLDSDRGRLDEVILVVEMEFFDKKNLLDVVKAFQEKEVPGGDPDGAAAFYSVYPWHIFSNIVPEHACVPRHRLMPPADVEKFLARERITAKDLPTIHSDDPPVAWLGGRRGQFVEVTRDSETAGKAIVIRHVIRAALTSK